MQDTEGNYFTQDANSIELHNEQINGLMATLL